MNKVRIRLKVNGGDYVLEVFPNKRLLDILRDDLGLTGTKEGCGIGECGACTVLLDGEAVNSCLVLAPQADGKEVLTVEGLGDGKNLHPLQKAFIEHFAFQCGFCTPGMLMAALSLISKNPQPTEEEIRKGLSGVLCRCTGYLPIIEAVKKAAEEMKKC
ncbi:MAG: (2Fe-2S)-binding protein [Caldiserica bacterium]|jgi:carbon-monoxide dehydrogenase small subunit|nr:(2Fe-2S)-binding protein [Caldisericota bacterium]MDH7563180.1 (2Fe-2S)-binding protein [Caldisericota bacterium]